jgi:predicted small lipoprotein YifL
MKQQTKWYVIATVFAVFTLSACAQQGPVLLDLSYQPPAKGEAPAPKKTVIGVSPFKDDRGISTSLVGKQTTSSEIQNEYVIRGTVSEAVTARLKTLLTGKGITVKDVGAWNGTVEDIRGQGIDLLVGGEIKVLWAASTSRVLNTEIKSQAQVRVIVADVAEKKIIRTLNLNSNVQREDVSFSLTRVEDLLIEALTGVFNQLLEDGEFKNAVK